MSRQLKKLLVTTGMQCKTNNILFAAKWRFDPYRFESKSLFRTVIYAQMLHQAGDQFN